MRFLPEPERRPQQPPARRREPRWLRPALLAACAATAVTTVGPWLQVKFPRLFGEHFGPPGWRSNAGFTCLMTSLFLLVLTLAESGSRAAREAVRPASVLLAIVATIVFVLHVARGPGQIGGTSAAWTPWFWAAAAGLAAVAGACAARASP